MRKMPTIPPDPYGFWVVLACAAIACLAWVYFDPDRTPAICLTLLLAQYIFVNLAFSTYTMNIVLIKDISYPFFAVVIFGAWLIGELSKSGTWTLPKTPVAIPIVATVLFLAYSTATSPIPALSVEEVGRFFANFTIVLALSKFLHERIWLKRALVLIAVGAVLMTGYGLSHWAGTDALEWLGRQFPEPDGRPARWAFQGWGGQDVFVSTHGNQNFFSGYLVATVFILIGWWFSTRRAVLLWGLPPLILAMTLCIVKGEARGAYLGYGAAAALFLLVLFANRRNLRVFVEPVRRNTLLAVVGLAVSVAAVALFLRPEDALAPAKTVYRNFATLLDFESSYTNAVRFVFWQDSIDGGLREPLVGRGVGVFNPRMPETRPNWYHHIGVSHNTMHAHNEWFEWIMEGGVVGTSLFVWLHLVLFASWARTLWKRRRDEDFPLWLGVGLGLISQLVQSNFDPETRWTGNAATNWFSAGLMVAWANLPPPDDDRPRKPWSGLPRGAPSPVAPAAAVALACVVALFSYSARRVWFADHHHSRANSFIDGGVSKEHGLAEALRAAELNPYHLSNYYKLAYAHLATDDFATSLRVYRTLQHFAPNYAQVHINLSYVLHTLGNRYGSAWERERAAIIEDNTRNHLSAAEYWNLLDRPERIIAHLRHAVKIDRDDEEGGRRDLFYEHDEILFRIAQQLGRQNRYEEAVRALQQAILRNPGHRQAFQQLLRIYRQSGRDAEAEELLLRLRKARPDDPLVLSIEMEEALRNDEVDRALDLAVRLSRHLPWPKPGEGGDFETARRIAEVAERVLRLGGRTSARAMALFARAQAGANGDYGRALENAARALQIDPTDSWIQEVYAEIAARRL